VTPEGFVHVPEAVKSWTFKVEVPEVTEVTGICMAEVYDSKRKLLGLRDRHLN
jgi:hypothetical protein